MSKIFALKRRALSAVTVIGFVLLALGMTGRPGQALLAYLFPEDRILYILDERSGGHFSRDLDRLYPWHDQRRDGIELIVLDVRRDDVASSAQDLLHRAGEGCATNPSTMLFIRLPSPTSDHKRALRRAVETQYPGLAGRSLLRRIVPLVTVPGDAYRTACEQLKDDWIYSVDNFAGLGIVINGETERLVGPCLPDSFLVGSSEPKSLAWMYLVIFIFAVVAYVIVRVFELKYSKNASDTSTQP